MNIIDYLEESAGRFPDKTAAADKNHHYTFSELKQRALDVAAALLCAAVSQGPVCVITDRSADPIVMFLGTALSGNYYVPLDPAMPIERMRFIVEDAAPAVILGAAAYRHLAEQLGFSGTYLVYEEIPGADTAAGAQAQKAEAQAQAAETQAQAAETQVQAAEAQAQKAETQVRAAGAQAKKAETQVQAAEIRKIAAHITKDTPLYMVYTSGSTGRPKGVLKSHGAMVSYEEAYCRTFDFTSDDVIGNQTPFFYDASAKDLYLMLKMGMTLEIIPTDAFSMPTALIEYMNARGITVIQWVPTALSLVAMFSPFSLVKPEKLRKVMFVGEVMPMKYLNKWRAALPDLQYVNLYGASELAGICCYYEVRGEYDNKAVLPMGRTLENCRIYLLDGDRIITEPGEPGEMYLVSDALALEYYHDPEKTAACFALRDFGEGPVRSFKTGDLARYDENGNLIFVSRNDHQIKHMGYRIELGEIEAVAGALPEIRRCCCLHNPAKRQLLLVCEVEEGVTLTGRELQSLLREKLLTYMLPDKVIPVDHLPVNANGKIDRTALQAEYVR